MSIFDTSEEHIEPSGLAFIEAATACARYDENFQSVANRDVAYTPAALRREAIAIAAMEGVSPRKENLARLLGKRELTNVERGTRIALDIYDALAFTSSLRDIAPTTDEIIQLFETSDASFGRVRRPDFQWTIETDAMWVLDEIVSAQEKTSPFAWIEMLRNIFVSGRFAGTAKRMSLLLAPWCLAQAFNCSSPILGAADGLRREIDRLLECAGNSEEWTQVFVSAASKGVANETKLIKELAPTRATISALCPVGRSTSSIGRAIDFMLGMPVFTSKTLTKALNITDRGAKEVLDKLLDADILEIEGNTKQNRLFVCRRTL